MTGIADLFIPVVSLMHPSRLLGLFALTLLFGCVSPVAFAQESGGPAVNPYGTGLGAQVLITNSGFGLGGYYRRAVSPSVSLIGELSLGAGKDEREVAFFDIAGRKDIPNKANYLLMMPFHLGLQKRVFQSSIEENFRPFVQFSFGPTLGWEYPYFADCNGDAVYNARTDCNGDGIIDTGEGERVYDAFGSLGKGHTRFGLGGNIALGAYFGLSQSVAQGVRIGYTFTFFTEGVQLLEPTIQDAQHFFGSPSITILFGKLF